MRLMSMSMVINWVDKRKQKPGPMDADAQGCVIAWHIYQGCMVYRWQLVMKNQYIAHWMCCPDGPGKGKGET